VNKPGRETEVTVDEEKEDENTNHDMVCHLEELIVSVSGTAIRSPSLLHR
jgi:hypothetical protein